MNELKVILWIGVVSGVFFWPMFLVALVAAVLMMVDGYFQDV